MSEGSDAGPAEDQATNGPPSPGKVVAGYHPAAVKFSSPAKGPGKAKANTGGNVTITTAFPPISAFSWNQDGGEQNNTVKLAFVNQLMKSMDGTSDEETGGEGGDTSPEEDSGSPNKRAMATGPQRRKPKEKSKKKKKKKNKKPSKPEFDPSGRISAPLLVTWPKEQGAAGLAPFRHQTLNEWKRREGGLRSAPVGRMRASDPNLVRRTPPHGRLGPLSQSANSPSSYSMTGTRPLGDMSGSGGRALVPISRPQGAGFAQSLTGPGSPGQGPMPFRNGMTTGYVPPSTAYMMLKQSQAEAQAREDAINRVRDRENLDAGKFADMKTQGVEAERHMAAKLQRQHMEERERIREAERDIERERQRERERERESELRWEREFELERKLMAERRREREMEMEMEREEERLQEEQRRLEWEEEREREWNFFQDMEREREKAWDRDRDLEQDRMQLRDEEREREVDMDRQRDRSRLEEREHEHAMERAAWKKLAEERELELQKERAALREIQEERERELERDVEHVRLRQAELAERDREQQELKRAQHLWEQEEEEASERQFMSMLELQERKSISMDWERDVAYEREKARDRQRLADREAAYAAEKARDMDRLEEFESDCMRLRERERAFEEERRTEWELEREVEREREREWATEREREIERQMAYEQERMLQREREEERQVLEDLFADRLLLEDIEWDERKTVMRMESETLQDLLQEFLAYSNEDIFSPEMSEFERLKLEENLQASKEEEYINLTREIEAHNAEAEEVWRLLNDAQTEQAKLDEDAFAAAVQEITIEYRAWVTALICEEERQRRMIYTAEALERGAPPPPPMSSAEWETAMGWNQHQRELLETYYKNDPPVFLLQLQQLQFQYLTEQKQLREQLTVSMQAGHLEQQQQWGAYTQAKQLQQQAMMQEQARQQQLQQMQAQYVNEQRQLQAEQAQQWSAYMQAQQLQQAQIQQQQMMQEQMRQEQIRQQQMAAAAAAGGLMYNGAPSMYAAPQQFYAPQPMLGQPRY